ncbi:MAG: hypothetical protein F6J98_02755 [Moorea sp. SIO4G2]|nr:hypothetical protein [Moorena sp. SIO4A3]NEO59374.1 hypothetical protein [Moorena sp. SIO4G2]
MRTPVSLHLTPCTLIPVRRPRYANNEPAWHDPHPTPRCFLFVALESL